MTDLHHDPIADELALRDLVSRFADAVTRRDGDSLAALFAVDGEWAVTGYGSPRGPEEIGRFIEGLLETWTVLVQGLLSGRIHLDPADHDRAAGRWYITEFGQRADGLDVVFAGVYHDTYVRVGGLWRFARRRYDSLYRNLDGAVTTIPFPADAPTM